MPVEGGLSFPATGERAAAEGVAFWSLAASADADGAPNVEAMGWTPSGALRLVGYLQPNVAPVPEAPSEEQLVAASPGFSFYRFPMPGETLDSVAVSPGDALWLWFELAQGPPPACSGSATAGGAPKIDTTPGTPRATCAVQNDVVAAELMVAVARTLRVVGCMAQEILGAPITSCDVMDLSLLGPAMGAAADELDRLPLDLPEPLDASRVTDEQTDVIAEFIEQTERIKNARAARGLLVRALRMAAFVTSAVGYLTELADAWGDFMETHEELECCRGGNVGGRAGCTCAERYPPNADGEGGHPVWRRVAGSPTSYVCEPCPEGSVWDPDAPTPLDELVFRGRRRPVGDRGACVLDYEPPEWTACPRTPTGEVDWDAQRALAEGFVEAVGDPRVQLVELAPRGGLCPERATARLYVPCGGGGEEYFATSAGGAVSVLSPALGRFGRLDWVFHPGYRANGMLSRGELLPGTTDGFGTLWTRGGAGSRDPGMLCDESLAAPVVGGRSPGTPLIAYPDEGPLAEAEREELGLPEGSWCWDTVDVIDMGHHPETSGVCPPDLAGHLFVLFTPGGLSQPREPEHAERRCVGAVGSDTCLPPQALPLPGACGPGWVGAPEGCVADPHYVERSADVQRHGVTPSSLAYADCCRANPDGFMCRGVVGSLSCLGAFNASLFELARPGGAWSKEFDTRQAPEPTEVRAGAGLSAYGEQLQAPYGFFVEDHQAPYCASGATASAEDGAGTICAPLEGDDPPGVAPAPVSPTPGASGDEGGRCYRIEEWDAEGWDWFIQAHESYVRELRERDDRWQAMSFYFQEVLTRARGAELWVIEDGDGVYRAAALLQKPIDHEHDVRLPGFVLEALASSTRGYGAQMLDCVLDDVAARGDLPIEAHPAEAAEGWWARQGARVNEDARFIEAVQPFEDDATWVFREPLDESCEPWLERVDELSRLGRGATMTAYALPNGARVLYVPNVEGAVGDMESALREAAAEGFLTGDFEAGESGRCGLGMRYLANSKEDGTPDFPAFERPFRDALCALRPDAQANARWSIAAMRERIAPEGERRAVVPTDFQVGVYWDGMVRLVDPGPLSREGESYFDEYQETALELLDQASGFVEGEGCP
ncbi:MAG: hypothetical protein CMN31_02925 [Sandaracinus sp.]|nr:hypothetical protein [Myxococcales bacterium]MAT24397.1 hypothetical protein [Sandaracinus sp.]MBJ70316.1 hypothetical protein [Sandaracinus sp.]